MLRKTRFPQKYRFNLLIYINLILYLERNNSVQTELNALFCFMASVILRILVRLRWRVFKGCVAVRQAWYSLFSQRDQSGQG